MRFSDMKISRQIGIGIALVLLMTIVFASVTWHGVYRVWTSAQDLYEHPFAAASHISAIQADVLEIHRNMGHLVIEDDPGTIESLMIDMALLDNDVYRQFDSLDDSYRGSAKDVEGAQDAFTAWLAIRAQTVQLIKENRLKEAQDRIKSTGTGGRQAAEVLALLDKLEVQAAADGTELHADAERELNRAILRQILFPAIFLLLLLWIGFILRKGIMKPLHALSQAADSLREGKLDARSEYHAPNEYGALSAAFNEMASSLQLEMQHKDRVAQLSATMMKANSLKLFCDDLLTNLIKVTNAHIGAVYFLNEDKTDYVLFSSIGSSKVNKSVFSAVKMEGEFGEVLATGQIQYIREIPPESQMVFATMGGDFQAKEIISIPVFRASEIISVISLVTISGFVKGTERLVTQMINEISSRISTLISAQQIYTYADKLKDTNTALEQQAKELSVQADELTEQNIELEVQKQQLDDASQLKDRFLSNMSHELRTPLNSIISLASVLLRRVKGVVPEEELKYLNVIERNGRSLLALVNDILDLSRIEAGKEELHLSRFHISQVMEEIADMQRSQAEEKGIRLTIDLPTALPDMVSEYDKIKHILQNIVGNAIKFTDQGEVAVSARMSGSQMEISVSDTGIGIAPEHLALVFDEFRQVDESPSRKQGGTGLGLAIAKKYARLLGGDIYVQSTQGVGSVFTLSLPAGMETLNPYQVQPLVNYYKKPFAANGSMTSMHSGKHILLVDDSEPAIIQISEMLKEAGYTTHAENSGKGALDYIGKVWPDGIILDLMMPEMDGFEVLRTLRGSKEHESLPVLILTAKHISKQELAFLKTNHVTQLIQKGAVEKRELLSAVRYLVDSSDREPAAREDAIVSRPQVLVVEDNADNRLSVKALLSADYDLVDAEDGQAGYELARKILPDLILMDISLPGIDGMQTLTLLRGDSATAAIPVIALTAKAMKGDREKLLRYGFDGYVSKPIEVEELESSIGRCMNGRP